MHRYVSTTLAVVVLITHAVLSSSCAGRDVRQIAIYQRGDESRSCDNIDAELKTIQDEIVQLIPQSDKTAKNWLLGTTGYFLVVPLFFMDLSKAEIQEIGALRHRYNHLLQITQNNSCGLEREPLPDFTDKKAMIEYHKTHKPQVKSF